MGDERFEWDAASADHIWDRHRISVDEVEEALADPDRIGRSAHASDDERRSAILGQTGAGRLLYVVYTRRRLHWRVVTARDATPRERSAYRRRGK